MREIKFRAWNKDSREMRNWEIVQYWQDLGMDLDAHPDDIPFVYMQYTGLKDKNGKEIYEGDVIYYENIHKTKDYEDIEKSKGVVRFGEFNISEEYDDPMVGFWAEWIWGYSKTFNFPSKRYIESNGYRSSQGLTTLMVEGGVEVIGNIYENPELINEQ